MFPPSTIRVGIIGNSTTIPLAKEVLEKLKGPIESPRSNKWLAPDYPGFSKNTTIKCDFATSENWEAIIKETEIKSVLDIAESVNIRIVAGVNLFKEKVRIISLEDNKPDVIICAMPAQIEEYCGISERTRGAKRPKFTALEIIRTEMKVTGQRMLDQWGFGVELEKKEEAEMDLDFHNALKGKVMEFNIPVQLLRESSMRGFLYYGQPDVRETGASDIRMELSHSIILQV